MSDIRLRLYSNSVVRGRVLKTLSLTVTDAESATPSAAFSVSQRVAGYLDSPFLVGVERLNPKTGKWFAGRNDLFIALEDEEDTSDASETVSFTGMGFVPWLLMWALHWWNWDSKDHKSRDWDGTPGKVLGTLLAEAQDMGPGSGRSGWGPHVTWDFSNTTDSYGNPWVADDKITMNLDLWKSYASLIDTWVDQGYFEWWTEGAKLRLARSGTGDDRTNVTLGGVGFTRSPAKASFNNVFTRLTVVPDGTVAFVQNNAGADSRWGQLEAAMSQSGVKQRAVAERNAAPILADGRAKKRELSYEWTASATLPTPYVDFTIGDEVSAKRRDGKQPQRVIGVVTRKEGDAAPTYRVIVGDKLIGLQARLAKKVSQGSTGTIIGGSGSIVPPNTGVDGLKPAAPAGLHVVSNVGSWAKDGSAVATVKLGWDAVTLSEDATPIDVDEYEVWARDPAALASVVTRTRGLEATVKSWRPPGVQLVSVRVRSVGGKWSELSPEISVTPAMPASIIPAGVTGLHVVSNVGAFRADGSAVAHVVLGWDAVTLSNEGLPLDIDRYEIRLKRGDEDAPFATSAEAGVAFTLAAGENVTATVHARSTQGVWGDYSLPLDVVGATPVQDTSPPSAPLLTSSLGKVSIAWDGLLESGAPAAGFQHVIVEVQLDDADFTRQGAPLAAQGSVPVSGPKGSVATVRFYAVDTLGRVGAVSNVSQITIVGVEGDDIEANSILTNHIGSGQITTSLLAADVGESLDISSNDSINLLVTAQGATADALETLSLWFRVDSEGAHIGEAGNPFQAHMRPEGFAITDNGVETTWWEAGRMIVPSLVTEEVVLSNHKFEKYGTGTVIRAV